MAGARVDFVVVVLEGHPDGRHPLLHSLVRIARIIDVSEKNLPRPTRSTLSQIRSGYSSYLNSYLHRINPTKYQENCPKCNSSIHNSQHLFNCPANPTDLTVTSLWENPVEAATFLGLETKNGPGDLDDND